MPIKRGLTMHARRWIALLLLLAFGCEPIHRTEPNSPATEPVRKATEPKSKPPEYETREDHDPNGIGKFYMGREIAMVMGHEAAEWLDRPEREKEERSSKLLEALKLETGLVVADVGAGSGYFTFPIAEKVAPKGKVLAVDIQEEMLDLIRKRAKERKLTNVEPILGTVTDPKLPDGGVDLILLVDVYHEFDHPYEMTVAMTKALKPGGRIAFVEFRMEDEKVPIKLVHKMSEKQVLKEMAPHALKHVKTIDVLPWQHIIIFERKAAEDAGKKSP
jgi:ubiquinone/menaquinone biosynthesis C-methylase UbiE